MVLDKESPIASPDELQSPGIQKDDIKSGSGHSNSNNSNKTSNLKSNAKQPTRLKTPSSSVTSSAASSSTAKPPKTAVGNKTRPSSALRKSKRGIGTNKRGITFKKTVAVLTIPNLDTYTIQEKEQSWFAADDYGQMEDECDLTAELLDRRKPLWPGQCARGLEAWTTEGEQRKEGHVQLALDIVWQAQLEQWKASSDIHECWEFIRSRYLAVTVPCLNIACKRASADEHEIQSYLAGVRSVEKNRLRILGIHQRDVRTRRVVLSASSQADAPNDHAGNPMQKVGRSCSEMSAATNKIPAPNRNHSADMIKGPQKGILSAAASSTNEDTLGALPPSRINHQKSTTSSDDDGMSVASSSSASRRISYQTKSKSKIPTSPVQSLYSVSHEDSLSRRMRSHMSVASEESTRRRMLRTSLTKPPL